MRRLLVVCAVAFAVSVFFFAGPFLPKLLPGILPGVVSLANFGFATAAADTATQPMVVADHVSVRALAVNALAGNGPASSASPVYLTNSSAANRLYVLSAANLLPVAGTGAAGSLGDGGAALAAQIDLASDSLVERSGVAIAPDGTIFIADTLNSTIRRIAGAASSEPGIIRSVAGRWAARQNISLMQPMGLALDSAENLYIADHAANSVLELVAVTGQLELLAHVPSPASLAVTPDGTLLYVASPETGAIYEIKTQSRAGNTVDNVESIAGFAAVQTPASAGQCPAPATSGVTSPCPAGIAVDRAGNLFVADAASGAIVRVAAVNFAKTIIASALSSPGEIALSASGDLFVSEQGRTRLVVLPQVVPPSNITLTGPGGVSAYNFANEPAGGTGPTQTFTLANTSASAIVGVAFAILPSSPADFKVSSTTCTASLAAHSSCTAAVAFTPSATGTRSSTITATDTTNATDSSSVSLTGTANDFSIQLASTQPTEVTTEQGGTATFNLVVMPSGNFGANGEKVLLTCPPAAPPADTVIAGSMPAATTCLITPSTVSVTPGASTPFQVMFTTTASIAKPITGAIPSGFFGGYTPGGHFALILAIAFAFILVAASAFSSRGKAHRLVSASAAFLLVAVIAAGCKSPPATMTATPIGVYTLSIQAQALDSSGNSLSAAGSITITLDVISD